VSKEELRAAVLQMAEELGRVPSLEELTVKAGISRRQIRRQFGTYQRCLESCGLVQKGSRRRIGLEAMFQDWVRVVRSLEKLPTIMEYDDLGKFSSTPVKASFGSWGQVPEAMKTHAESQGRLEEYKDVFELVAKSRIGRPQISMEQSTLSAPKMLTDQPVYGPPIFPGGPLIFAPTNEAGVQFLFGAVAERLGFLALRIQTEFPDCEAMRIVEGGRLQRVRIEIEHRSHNFLHHMHDPGGCDLIVCWEHNWPQCPLEVIELKTAAKKIALHPEHGLCRNCRRAMETGEEDL
jgi:hypothetical protein